MAPKEILAMRLLMDNPRGLYGSEFVHLSKGALGRGSVYTILARLVDKGYVREVEEEPMPELQMKRTRHFATEMGTRAVANFAASMGCSVIEGAFSAAGGRA